MPDTLQELRQVDLRGNPLTSVPAAITTLPRLDRLDLRWVMTLTEPASIATLETRGCVAYR
jgi:Leucine-rich repeat (LRR) protein